MFTIEKGIPAPVRGSATNFPLTQMEIGDSFLVPVDFADQSPEAVTLAKRKVASLAAARQGVTKTTGSKFAVRRLENGVRVWRTA